MQHVIEARYDMIINSAKLLGVTNSGLHLVNRRRILRPTRGSLQMARDVELNDVIDAVTEHASSSGVPYVYRPNLTLAQ